MGDFPRLGKLDSQPLPKLHDCYGSYDLAIRLLLEHDRREGTKHTETPVRALPATTSAQR